MPKKRREPKEVVAKLRQAHVLASQGTPVADAIRRIGVTAFSITCGRFAGSRLLAARHGIRFFALIRHYRRDHRPIAAGLGSDHAVLWSHGLRNLRA